MTDATVLDTLREINREMVRADSAAELKRSVCERFAESVPYQFAWIGVVDEATGEVVPEASAGVGSGYLDTVTVTTDASETGRGPTGRAVRTREVQAVQDVADDPTYAPWRAAAQERGYRSTIAIPLVYEDAEFGVLNVYADRPDAFAGREQELLAGVGETIGYALHNFGVQARQRRQYRNLFEDAPLMYVLTRDEDGRAVIEDCNRRFLEKLGIEKGDAVDESLAAFYSDDDARRLHEYGYERALADEFTQEERDLVAADGETLRTRMRAVPRIGADGEVIGTLAVYTDVTEQKRAEAVLRHAKALEASMDGIAIFDRDGECVHANEALRSLLGYESVADVVGNPYTAFFPGTERERFEREILPVLTERGTWRGETTALRADGTTFPAEASIAAVEDIGSVVIVRDVTERKERERKLEGERRRYRAITETAPDAILVADPETRELVEANSQAETLTGYSKDDLVGMSQSELHPDPERYREFFDAHVEASEAGGPVLMSEFDDGGDLLIEREDGETRPVEINANLIDVGDERLFLGMFRDLTERRERERRLRELRRQYETVFQNTQDALFLVDVEGDDAFRIARINRREEALTGLTAGAVEGERLEEALDEEAAARVRPRYRKCVETGEPMTYEEELTLPEGTRVWQTKLTPVVVDGEVTQLVGEARDITALREYEARLESQRDRLELLNRIVRHDIRNDMQVVLGFGSRIRDRVSGDLRTDADRVVETTRHSIELTETARDLVEMIRRPSEPAVEPTDLGDALRGEFENTERSYPEASFRLGEIPDATVRANDLLTAVFRNLLHNAVQHNDGDDPHVWVTAADRGDSVRVSVADDGPGVPPERREEIFGRGTADLDSPGTGIGLYLVDTLVDRYGGDVWVEGRDEGGSVFHVELPKADG